MLFKLENSWCTGIRLRVKNCENFEKFRNVIKVFDLLSLFESFWTTLSIIYHFSILFSDGTDLERRRTRICKCWETKPGASQRTGGSYEDHGQDKAWQVAFRALLGRPFDRRKVSNPPKPSWKKQSEIKIDDEGGTAKPKERTCEAHRSEVVNPTMMKR